MGKLPVISGLAEAFEINTGLQKYVAGLWEEDLLEGLLWSRRNDSSSSSHATAAEQVSNEYRAPSWSWASIDEPVEWWSRHLAKDLDANQGARLKILKATTSLDGLDPKGRLAGGWLRIEGVLKHPLLVACGPWIFTKMGKKLAAVRVGTTALATS